MKIIYNIGISLYVAMIHMVAPFNIKAKQWVKGRKNCFKKIKEQVNPSKKTAWFHVSSLGEFEQGRPVMEEFRKAFPDYQIVLTFFSPSGYEIRKNYAGADAIFYLPYDSQQNAKQFLALVNPSIAFFVKYDFWYHYLTQLKSLNVPTYIFSAIFRPGQLFFKTGGAWYRKMLHSFTHIFVQNEESKELLKGIGIHNVSVGGDTRFDRVFQIANESKDYPEIETFCGQNKIIVAGSSWEPDEQLLNNYLKTLGENTKVIIAPHEIHESNIQRIINLFGSNCVRYSQIHTLDISNAKVLIIDAIGFLSSIYKYGHVAYIGGGFGKGIHNTLEAATYGIPVVFGPNFHKFQEARDLIANQAGFNIATQDELNNKFSEFFDSEDYRQNCGKSALNYVNKMRGGTQLLMSKITEK